MGVARWVLVAAVALGLARPRDLVWCHAGPGHSAVEEVAASCCAAPGGDAACARDDSLSGVAGAEASPAGPSRRGRSGGGDEPCTDIFLGAPAHPPADARLATPSASAFVPDPVVGSFSFRARALSAARAGDIRLAAHEASLSVVLRT